MKIEFKINNQLVSLEVTEQTKLVDIIRDRLGLKGTKENCRRGQCGMCTVILNGQAVRSCQIPAQKASGSQGCCRTGATPDHHRDSGPIRTAKPGHRPQRTG